MTTRTAKTQLTKLIDAYRRVNAAIEIAKREDRDICDLMARRGACREHLGRLGMSTDEINAL